MLRWRRWKGISIMTTTDNKTGHSPLKMEFVEIGEKEAHCRLVFGYPVYLKQDRNYVVYTKYDELNQERAYKKKEPDMKAMDLIPDGYRILRDGEIVSEKHLCWHSTIRKWVPLKDLIYKDFIKNPYNAKSLKTFYGRPIPLLRKRQKIEDYVIVVFDKKGNEIAGILNEDSYIKIKIKKTTLFTSGLRKIQDAVETMKEFIYLKSE